MPGSDDDPEAECQGPVERAVRGDVDVLDLVGPLCRSLSETAFNLARTLDGDAGMATAAVARELRATLKDLREASGDDDGTAVLIAELSTPLGNTPPP
jgi:hypothetical protein